MEGSRLTYTLQLNKPVARARWVGKEHSLALAAQSNAVAVLPDFLLTNSARYSLELTDAEGRTNKFPTDFVLQALTNQRPDVKLVFPRGDPRVSRLEELQLQAEASDDFGLLKYGVGFGVAGQEPQFVELGQSAPAQRQAAVQLLDPAGEARRGRGPGSDLLRVGGRLRPGRASPPHVQRHLFRRGAPVRGSFPAGPIRLARKRKPKRKPGGGGDERVRLAELQKQIVVATWNLQRRKGGRGWRHYSHEDNTFVSIVAALLVRPVLAGAGTPAFDAHCRRQGAPDCQPPTLRATTFPTSALCLTPRIRPWSRLDRCSTEAANARDRAALETAIKEMERSRAALEQAKKSPEKLPAALAAEQAAYQALLKATPREYRMTRSRNRGQSGNSSGQPSQQELNQLELTGEENRYETERQATATPTQQQREQAQTVDRLKQLARRQQDLNDRLRDLQTALQEARTDQEREEIQRQLKRLRDEERQMLSDVDELRQRLEQSPDAATTSRCPATIGADPHRCATGGAGT